MKGLLKIMAFIVLLVGLPAGVIFFVQFVQEFREAVHIEQQIDQQVKIKESLEDATAVNIYIAELAKLKDLHRGMAYDNLRDFLLALFGTFGVAAVLLAVSLKYDERTDRQRQMRAESRRQR
jgi:acyl-CoA synthetase (AMP-forming)/AMP-acid ligase II